MKTIQLIGGTGHGKLVDINEFYTEQADLYPISLPASVRNGQRLVHTYHLHEGTPFAFWARPMVRLPYVTDPQVQVRERIA